MQTQTDYQAVQAARRAVADNLAATFPHLVRVSDKVNALVAAAKNIRIELAREFPGAKFTVRSDRFSMGDAVRVSWIDGPTSDQVDAIVNKYTAGSFDGMTDSYSYNDSHAWTDAFGDAKYVSTHREFSDRMVASVIARVARWLGGIDSVPTVADYRAGRTWNVVTSGGCDFGRELSQALSRHTYCAGRKVSA